MPNNIQLCTGVRTIRLTARMLPKLTTLADRNTRSGALRSLLKTPELTDAATNSRPTSVPATVPSSV